MEFDVIVPAARLTTVPGAAGAAVVVVLVSVAAVELPVTLVATTWKS